MTYNALSAKASIIRYSATENGGTIMGKATKERSAEKEGLKIDYLRHIRERLRKSAQLSLSFLSLGKLSNPYMP